MAVREVRLIGDPVLRTKAQEVTDFGPELKRLVSDMIDTMRDTRGVGLAAPQIGVELRVFVYEVDGETGHIINPVLENSEEQSEPLEEGRLSIPGLSYTVVRAYRTVAKGVNFDGEPIALVGNEFLSRVFQHETDHLDGILFIDRLELSDIRAPQAELNSSDFQNTVARIRRQRAASVGSAFGVS